MVSQQLAAAFATFVWLVIPFTVVSCPLHQAQPATISHPPLARSQATSKTGEVGYESPDLTGRGIDTIPSKKQLDVVYKITGDRYYITGPDNSFADTYCNDLTKTITIPFISNPSKRIGMRAILANLWQTLGWNGLNSIKFTDIENEEALDSIDEAWILARDNNQLGDAYSQGTLLVLYSEAAFDALIQDNKLGKMVQRMLEAYVDFKDFYIRSVQIGRRRDEYMTINIRQRYYTIDIG